MAAALNSAQTTTEATDAVAGPAFNCHRTPRPASVRDKHAHVCRNDSPH